jgi:DNA-binding NtrC family response regulator
VKHILIVDDDSSVLDLVSRTLRAYRLSLARDPDEALHVARSVGSLDLLITDYLMPSMTGDELIGRLRERWPALNVLILTGHAALLAAEHAPWWEKEAHLEKPFDVGELRAVVSGLIGPPTP